MPGPEPPPTAEEAARAAGFHGYRGLVIDERNGGRRIDAYLSARFPNWSRTRIARFIQEGVIVSEDRRLKPSSRLAVGERLRLYVPGLAPETPPPDLPPVIYEDDRLLIVNKPPGMLVHPSGLRWSWALIGLARQARPGAHLDLVHRLDRETSGVVVLTKDTEMNAWCKKAFQQHRVSKTYQALARGLIPWESQLVDAPLGHAPGSEIRIRQGVVPDGAEARTGFRVLAHLPTLTLLACHLHTGRTHQIRAHLEHLGHPLLGDKLYGHPDAVFLRYLEAGADPLVRAAAGFPRQALHAWKLTLPLPNGQEVRAVAPLPPDLQALLDGAAPDWPDGLGADAPGEEEAAPGVEEG